ncbi:MAG: DUF1365 domain-containing protein [Verrucomicrobia bacterium]|nr:MAG: DUF1365 domain-containing protein [Verrucomicrobiota bacterium]
MHRRLRPKAHRFVYEIFMLAVDLDEWTALGAISPLLRVDAPAVLSLRDGDYLPLSEADTSCVSSVRDRLCCLLRERGITEPPGRAELVTMPAVFGYRFNPVSFIFAYDRRGRPLAAVAEVTNTFREVKHYVTGPDCLEDGAFRTRCGKYFYVSPFSPVDGDFAFRMAVPAETLDIAIDHYANGELSLVSALRGKALPLSGRTLASCFLKFPFQSLAVITRIHWHALLLWMKRVPWFAKAASPHDQRDVRRPHKSILRHHRPNSVNS